MTQSLQEARALVRALEGKRQERVKVWQNIQRFILPGRGLFGGETASSAADKATRRLCSAGTRAARLTAAGLTSSITPENLRWYRLDPRDRGVAERPYVRQWLDATESILNNALTAGGFYAAIHNFNLDFSTFGCALLFVDVDKESFVRFEDCTIGTWAISLDSRKQLDTVSRRIKYTARTLQELYPEKVSKSVKDLCNSPATALHEIEIVHLVTKNPEYKAGKMNPTSRPWRHYVYEEGSGEQFLFEGGYFEMPYMYAAWDQSHNVYGSGPGDDALPDIMQSQELKRLNLVSANMRVNPPMLVPAAYQGRVNLSPGSMTRSSAAESEGFRPLLQGVAYDSIESRAELSATESDIRDALMSSIFATLPMEQRPPGMTATEFLARKQERLLLLGPAISRYMTQLTSVLVRMWASLDRALQVPPPPPTITDAGTLDVVYTSPMSQALRQHGVESTQAVVEMVIRLAQADPSALDKLNIDEVIDETASALGAPGRIVRSDEEVAQIRAQKQQAQMEQMQNDQSQKVAQAAAQLGSVSMNNTLAGAVAGMAGLAGKASANAPQNAEGKA